MPHFKKLFCIGLLLSTPLWGSWVSSTPEKLCPGEMVRFGMSCEDEEYATVSVTGGDCVQHYNFNRASGANQNQTGNGCPTIAVGNSREMTETVTTSLSGVKRTTNHSTTGSCSVNDCSGLNCEATLTTGGVFGLFPECACHQSDRIITRTSTINCGYSLGYIDKIASSHISLQFSLSGTDILLHNIRCCSGNRTIADGSCGSDNQNSYFNDQAIASAQPGTLTSIALDCTQDQVRLSWTAPETGDVTAFNLTVPGRSPVWIPYARQGDIELAFPNQSGEVSLLPFYHSVNGVYCQGSRQSVSVNPAVASVTGVHFRQTQCDRGEVSWNTVDDELPVVYRVTLHRGKQNITLTDQASASPFSFTLSDYMDGAFGRDQVSVTSVALCGAYRQASGVVISDSFNATGYMTEPLLLTRLCGVAGAEQDSLSVDFLLEPGGQRIPQTITINSVNSSASFGLEPLEDGHYKIVLSLPGNTTEVTFSAQPVFTVAPGEQCYGQPTLYTGEINPPQLTVNYTIVQDSQTAWLSFGVDGVNGSCAYCLAVLNKTLAQDSRFAVCGTEVSDEFPCSMPQDIAVVPADKDNLQALNVYSNSTDDECWQAGVDLEPTLIPGAGPVTTTESPTGTTHSTYLLPTTALSQTTLFSGDTITRTTLFPQQTKGAASPENGEKDSWVWGVVAVESVVLAVVVSASLFVVYKIYRFRYGGDAGVVRPFLPEIH